jgi:hypothetical protein
MRELTLICVRVLGLPHKAQVTGSDLVAGAVLSRVPALVYFPGLTLVAPISQGCPCRPLRAFAPGVSQRLWRASTDPYRDGLR